MFIVCAVPFMLPHMQVDKGAIGFVLSGANIMCPGLTSPGARMTKVDKDTIVVSLHRFKAIQYIDRTLFDLIIYFCDRTRFVFNWCHRLHHFNSKSAQLIRQ
jgi:PUA domain protein